MTAEELAALREIVAILERRAAAAQARAIAEETLQKVFEHFSGEKIEDVIAGLPAEAQARLRAMMTPRPVIRTFKVRKK